MPTSFLRLTELVLEFSQGHVRSWQQFQLPSVLNAAEGPLEMRSSRVKVCHPHQHSPEGDCHLETVMPRVARGGFREDGSRRLVLARRKIGFGELHREQHDPVAQQTLFCKAQRRPKFSSCLCMVAAIKLACSLYLHRDDFKLHGALLAKSRSSVRYATQRPGLIASCVNKETRHVDIRIRSSSLFANLLIDVMTLLVIRQRLPSLPQCLVREAKVSQFHSL